MPHPNPITSNPMTQDGDELKYADEMDMPGQKFETKQRITVRNLRIREDTAKYLFNLDPNSAYYDPKTRSMRENPLANTGKAPEELVAVNYNDYRLKPHLLRLAPNLPNIVLFCMCPMVYFSPINW